MRYSSCVSCVIGWTMFWHISQSFTKIDAKMAYTYKSPKMINNCIKQVNLMQLFITNWIFWRGVSLEIPTHFFENWFMIVMFWTICMLSFISNESLLELFLYFSTKWSYYGTPPLDHGMTVKKKYELYVYVGIQWWEWKTWYFNIHFFNKSWESTCVHMDPYISYLQPVVHLSGQDLVEYFDVNT